MMRSALLWASENRTLKETFPKYKFAQAARQADASIEIGERDDLLFRPSLKADLDKIRVGDLKAMQRFGPWLHRCQATRHGMRD